MITQFKLIYSLWSEKEVKDEGLLLDLSIFLHFGASFIHHYQDVTIRLIDPILMVKKIFQMQEVTYMGVMNMIIQGSSDENDLLAISWKKSVVWGINKPWNQVENLFFSKTIASKMLILILSNPLNRYKRVLLAYLSIIVQMDRYTHLHVGRS